MINIGTVNIHHGHGARGQLLQTGQTVQYAGYKDDGYYQKGIAKRYAVLDTGQHAGTTAITLNGKTDDHSNNCVLDLNAGLMWTRSVIGSVGPASDGKLPWTTNGSGEGIFDYCDAANAAGLAGYADWRVPNVVELLTLLTVAAASPVPDATAFPVWPVAGNGNYLSCSTYGAGYSTYCLVVTFLNGSGSAALKTATGYGVLVRGG